MGKDWETQPRNLDGTWAKKTPEQRIEQINIRLTPSQWADLHDQAEVARETMTQWIIESCYLNADRYKLGDEAFYNCGRIAPPQSGARGTQNTALMNHQKALAKRLKNQ